MKIFSIIMGLSAGFLFGIATPLSKLALTHLNNFQLAGLLYIGAAIAFFPYILTRGKKEFVLFKKSQRWKSLAGIILCGGILGPLFLMLGLQTANSMSVSIWLNMELVATAILGVVFFKEHLGRFAFIGIILTIGASAIISSQEEHSSLISGIFIIIACFCWGVDNHLTAIVDGITPQTITFIKGLFGGTVNLFIGMFVNNWRIHTDSVASTLLIGIFSYGVSIFLYVTSAQNLGATRSQILFSTSPFWGIFAAFLILKEPIHFITMLAIFFLIIGIFFTHLSSHKHLHFHEKAIHIHVHSHDDAHHNHEHPELKNRKIRHSHLHEHDELEHSHEHYPDIHHRHNHSQ